MQRNQLTPRRIAGGVRRRLRRLAGRAEPTRDPLLSVIVPVYNVQGYLAECLDSVLAQSMSDLEIVAVDDGSTDQSPAILSEYAARDPRVRVLRRPNGGLGAARNTGVESARGRYLTFVDSDDTIPEDAYHALVGSLERTGSDLAGGQMARLIRGEERVLFWSRRLHARPLFGIRVEQFPKIIRDFYTPNKVYRRSFWEANNLRFREVGIFEDQPLITRAYCAAERIDVLPDLCYRWRVRDDGSSLSQNMLQAPEVRARHEAVRLTLQVLEDRGSATLIDAWRWSMLQDHVPHYLTNTTEDGFAATVDMLRDVATEEEIRRAADVSPDSRILCHRALRESRDACTEFARETRGKVRNYPVVWEGERAFAALPGFDEGDVPRDLYELGPWMLAMHAWLADCSVSAPGVVSVRGRAYLEYVDPAEFGQQVTLIACHDTTGTEIELPARLDQEGWTGAGSTHGWIAYDDSGFVADVPLAELARAVPDEPSDWRFEVRVDAHGRSDRSRFQGARHVSVYRLAALDEVDGRLARASWGPDYGLVLRYFRPLVITRGVDLDETRLRIEADIDAGYSVGRVRLKGTGGQREAMRIEHLSGNRWALEADVAALRDEEVTSWRLAFYSPGSGRHHLFVTDPFCVAANRSGVSVRHNRFGHLQVGLAQHGLLVTDARLEPDGLRIEGLLTGLAPEEVRLSLSSGRVDTTPVSVEVVEEPDSSTSEHTMVSVRALLPFAYDEWGIEHRGVLPQGNFYVVADPVAVRLSPEAVAPDTLFDGRLRAELSFPRRQHVVVRVRPPLADEAIGKVNRRLLLDAAAAHDGPLRDAVLFQCLRGDNVGDSQLAISRRLAQTRPDLAQVWATLDHTIGVPEGSERVIVHSREWFEALATCRWIVVNHELPKDFRKREGQVVVQTYHGHPYKLMGLSRWRQAGWSEPRIDLALEGARTWDYLLAPSPLAERLYAENFPGPARILTVGHPRNDVLVGPEAESIRRRTRQLLGLGDEIAVLYAPTWRDYSSADPWKSKMVEFLDPQEFSRELGAGYTLLLRGHPAHQRHAHRMPGAGRVVDVTDYPEINDLILASDVGLFDFSSIRFDFSVTGKPMLFFVPDDEIYLASVGTLLDFDESTPGPHSRTFAELKEQLLDLDAVRAEYAVAYEKFVTRFNPLDDGHAADRLVDAVFGEIPERRNS